ncbi:MAG TPA: response regulator transcription factor [Ktedonobacterales bacterium]|nr:response regulator transcription factor [Ktedonobacterales bacterium]
MSESATISILIAEDTQAMRAMLRRALARQSDMSVVGEAASGSEVIEAVERLRPDALLLDMDIVTGDTRFISKRLVLKDLRELLPDTKVIILSAYGDPSVKSLALNAGAVAYLEKPVRIAELLAAIRTAATPETPPADGDGANAGG